MAKKTKQTSQQLRQNKTMRRRWVTRTRIVRYGVNNFTRNAWLTVAATAVMTITLLIIFVTVLTSSMLTNTVDELRNKVDISVYFKAETTDKTLTELADKMRNTENVKGVSVVNSKKAFDEYVESSKGDTDLLQTISEVNVNFPATMRIQVKDIDNLDSVKNIVEKDELFQKWLDTRRAPTYAGEQQEIINNISRWADFAQKGGLIAGIVFLVISVLVIFNTIRMAIFSRREEIDMMKSIGADRNFIRGPFLIEAEMYGFFAALLATALGYVGFMALAPKLEDYGIVVAPIRDALIMWSPLIVLAMIVLGMLIGYISSRLAVRRYLQP